ncbi:hypothetical protein QAD02_015347 [Eretmocerus hayati]|uniref:Uncharacterized protein n=1 Tax=Eretmocerus hayati TaxID=131215 RepID=A0ACC2PCR3_9HYME|nr:hypothetical protein QAD02_015347 [Eretmocerus hayati]
MSNLVSLDDIIKKSKASKNQMRNNKGGPKKPGMKNGAKPNGTVSNRPRVTKAPNQPIQDARFKIIQKKRKFIGDARDKLAQIAKQSDARLKLQKLRATTSKKGDVMNNIRKSGRNGRIPPTNKISSSHLPRSLQTSFIPPATRSLGYRAAATIPETHYVNDLVINYGNDYLVDPHRQTAVRRTVSNEYAPVLPPPPPIFSIKSAPYDWDKPSYSSSLSRSQPIRSSDHLSSTRPRDYKVIPRSGMSKLDSSSYKDDWSFTSKSRTILPDVESKYYSVRSQRDIGVRSRLDSPPSKSSRTLSSASRPRSSPQPTGYRIVVSNLQPNVTQEDIKELFEDVGELLISRLVRPGIAEVVYKTLKDATKAVETYHNRQLDGHPMKCLLVNPRPKTSTGSVSSGRILSQPRSSSGYSQPSLGTVHRALFDR